MTLLRAAMRDSERYDGCRQKKNKDGDVIVAFANTRNGSIDFRWQVNVSGGLYQSSYKDSKRKCGKKCQESAKELWLKPGRSFEVYSSGLWNVDQRNWNATRKNCRPPGGGRCVRVLERLSLSHTHTKKKQKNLSMTGNRVYKRIKTDHRSNVAAFALIRYSRPATDRRTRTRQATRCVHGKQHIPTCRSSVCIAWHCQVLTLGTEKSSQVSGAYLVL